MVMIRLGYTNEQILAPENAVIVGGDDVIQCRPVDFDETKYIAEAALMGIEMAAFEHSEDLNGIEFFSNTF